MAAANAELVQLVTNQAKDLLAQIEKDIVETSKLTEDDRKNCMEICQRVETEYTRMKIEFLRTSLRLIDQALGTSDGEKLRQIHQAWSLALENVTRLCKTLVGPLMEVLRVLSRQDGNLRLKYASLMTGTIVSSALAGAAIGVLAFHAHPGCGFQLAAEVAIAVAGGALLAIAIALGCLSGCITIARLRTVYQRCSDSVRLMLAKCFPDCFNGSAKDPSDSDLAMVIKNAIDTLNIKDDIWKNPVALEVIKDSAQNQLKHLQQQ
jgi:hypothetical protein